MGETTYDDEIDDAECIRGKWMLDGCETLDEVIETLGALQASFKKLKAEGYELNGPIEDDYGFISKKSKDASK